MSTNEKRNETTFSHFHYVCAVSDVCVCSYILARDNTKALKRMLPYLIYEIKGSLSLKTFFLGFSSFASATIEGERRRGEHGASWRINNISEFPIHY